MTTPGDGRLISSREEGPTTSIISSISITGQVPLRATILAAAIVTIVACSTGVPPGSDEPSLAQTPAMTPTPTSSPPSSAAGSPAGGEPISGLFEVNGRRLFIDCMGTGTPTLVIDAGESQTADEMADIKPALAERGRVCSYDRPNHGRSGAAPTPRTGNEVVTDLHGLLAAAAVPGPYVLIGHSAGGMFVQLYARTFPDEIAGVLVMNAVPPCHEWMEKALPAMTAQEQKDERAYYAGANDEPVDYCATSDQIAAKAPPSVPLEVLISTIAQCDSVDDVCGRTYPAYTEVMRAVSDAWPAGHFAQVESIHSIYVGKPEAVIEAVDRVLDRIARP